jgi:hypothetical protein
MGRELASLFVSLGLDNRQFTQGLDSAQKSMGAFGKDIIPIVAAVAAAGFGMVELAKHTINAGMELKTMSMETGISINSLSQLKYVAEVSGKSLGDIQTAMRGAANALETARTPTSAAAKAFRELGLNVRELLTLSPEQKFMAIAEALSRVIDPTMRAALAMDVFGRSGTYILPIIDDINRKMSDAARRAEFFTPEDLKNLSDAHTAMVNMGLAWEKFTSSMAKATFPALTQLLNLLTSIADFMSAPSAAPPSWAPGWMTGQGISHDTSLGRFGLGNIDLTNRPQVRNPNGSISTVLSTSFEEDNQEVLVPMVSKDGKIMTLQEAIDEFHKTGLYLGKFDTPEEADIYAETLHQSQANFYDLQTPSSNEPDVNVPDVNVYVTMDGKEIATHVRTEFTNIQNSNVNTGLK